MNDSLSKLSAFIRQTKACSLNFLPIFYSLVPGKSGKGLSQISKSRDRKTATTVTENFIVDAAKTGYSENPFKKVTNFELSAFRT